MGGPGRAYDRKGGYNDNDEYERYDRDRKGKSKGKGKWSEDFGDGKGKSKGFSKGKYGDDFGYGKGGKAGKGGKGKDFWNDYGSPHDEFKGKAAKGKGKGKAKGGRDWFDFDDDFRPKGQGKGKSKDKGKLDWFDDFKGKGKGKSAGRKGNFDFAAWFEPPAKGKGKSMSKGNKGGYDSEEWFEPKGKGKDRGKGMSKGKKGGFDSDEWSEPKGKGKDKGKGKSKGKKASSDVEEWLEPKGKGKDKGKGKGKSKKGKSEDLDDEVEGKGKTKGGKAKGKGKDEGKDKGKDKGKGKAKDKGEEQKGKEKSKTDAKAKGMKKTVSIVEGKKRGKRPKADSGMSNTVSRRGSVLSTSYVDDLCDLDGIGGTTCTIDTGLDLLGEFEAVIFEPPLKKLAPEDFVTTGVVICLQGLLPMSDETLEEWSTVMTEAGWLKMGITVVVPNFQVGSSLEAKDVAAIINATMVYVDFDQCILIGKDLVAPRMLEVVEQDLVDSMVAGLVIIGPSLSPPSCKELCLPILLMWARDDDISEFSACDGWVDALEEQDGTVTIKVTETGGHSFGDMVTNDTVACEAVRNFIVSSLIIGNLEQQQGMDRVHTLKSEERMERLADELPEFLKEAMNRTDSQDSDGEEMCCQMSLAKSTKSTGMGNTVSARPSRRRLSRDIPAWLNAGLMNATE